MAPMAAAARSLLYATLTPSVPRYDPFNGFAVYNSHFNLLSMHYYGSLGARPLPRCGAARSRCGCGECPAQPHAWLRSRDATAGAPW